jgi:hypothetical protein
MDSNAPATCLSSAVRIDSCRSNASRRASSTFSVVSVTTQKIPPTPPDSSRTGEKA